MGPYIFLVCAAYNGEVQSTLQRMTEKKAVEAFTVHAGMGAPGLGGPTNNWGPRAPALSFQACSSPVGPGLCSRPSDP